MLRIPTLTPVQQRELRHWLGGGDPHLARRAQFVLWSARGWSVPALAHALGCCRRTVRRWLHAFLAAGLAGLLDRSRESTRQSVQREVSAITAKPSTREDHLVPVVPISIPELRRILVFHCFTVPVSPDFFWHWSTYRRYKQALAKRSHYKKRGENSPVFDQMRL